MPTVKSVDEWSGANNVSDPTALPPPTRYSRAEALVEALNVDVLPSGGLHRRVGFHSVSDFDTYPDSVFHRVGSNFIYIDFKGDFYIQNAFTNEVRVVSIDQFSLPFYPGHILTAVEHNGELFGITDKGRAVRTDGVTMRRWGVPDLKATDVEKYPGTGGIPPGAYKVALTLVNAHGEEGAPYEVFLVESDTAFDLTLRPSKVNANAQGTETVRVYMSADSGTTLYLQKEYPYFLEYIEYRPGVFGEYPRPTTIRTVTTTGMELVTQHLRQPPRGSILCSHHGVILIANGKTLFYTTPLRVHQVDYRKGFFQFPSAITNVVSMDSGVYVTADKTYFLPKLETTDVSQHEVLDIPAVAGSAKRVSGNKAVWLTAYGMVIAEDGGNTKFLHRDTYAIPLMDRAEVGIMQYNGLEMAVVMPRGAQRPNRLAYDVPQKSGTLPPPV